MFRPTPTDEMVFIALLFEAFLYGLNSGIFGMYLQYHASKQDTNKTQNIIFYSMCALYVSSASVFVFDIAYFICQFKPTVNRSWITPIVITQTTLFACSNFLAQFILIYRCWIVWGRNNRIVIFPLILAFAFPVIRIVGSRPTLESFKHFGLRYSMTLIGLALSLTVNALVTGLIVFRIFKVFREVKATSDNILGATDGSKLRSIILVLIESAAALFSIQLARLVVFILPMDLLKAGPFSIIVVTHQMMNGITPTVILVRTSMELSFHDEKSMEEVAIGSLRFASNDPGSVPETGSIGRDADIDVQRSNDINVVER